MGKRFDAMLAAGTDMSSDKKWLDALACVTDTAWMCSIWLDEHAPEFTTDHMLEMTRLVLDRSKNTLPEPE